MVERGRKRSHPWVEPLEGRAVPGTLTIAPPGIVDPNYDLAVPDRAKPGLEMARAHTQGVITWTPDA
jgi:hypothetical protein